MIRVVLLGCAPFQPAAGRGGGQPRVESGPIAAAFSRLRASGFALPGAELRLALAPLTWFGASSAAVDAAASADAVVLLDSAKSGFDFSVVAAAVNRADPRLTDAAGDRWPGDVLAPGGQERLTAVLDPGVFARALALAGLSADVAEPADAGIANLCFYTLLRRGVASLRLRIGPGCASGAIEEALRAAALFAGAFSEVRTPLRTATP